MEKEDGKLKTSEVFKQVDSQSERHVSGSPPSEINPIASKECDNKNESDNTWIDDFRNFLSTKLNLSDKEETPAVLKEPTLCGIIEYIKSGKCNNIITMAGAGISTAAGIPDFRSPGTGLYNNLSAYDLPDPEAIFDIAFFKSNPEPFFALAKELYPSVLKPTVSHYFIRLLHEKNLLLRHYTQNIDTLEHIADIPCEKIIEAHGSFRTSHCTSCLKEYNQEWMKDKIFTGGIPHCEECSAVVKPDIIFFGETLPEKFFCHMQPDFAKCDLLIVMGTSLTVEPFASLVNSVNSSCPRLLINKEKVPVVLPFWYGMGVGLAIGRPGNKRDVGLFGDCDEQCITLVEKLGWKNELDELMLLTKDKL